MTRHSPITPDDGKSPRPASRRPSLVERAAGVYDFGASLRGGGRPVAPAPLDGLPPVIAQRAAEPQVESEAVAEFAPVVDVPFEAPEPRGRHGKVSIEGLEDGGFIVPGRAVTALSEEFRIVKRQILQGTDGPNGRVLLVCSARPDEGKTFCAVNLALSLAAEKDREVVLIDADVAKPEILSTFGLENGPGLLDALADPAIDIETCLIHTDVPHLSVLPAGGHTNEATELLASARTQAVLARLRTSDPRRIIVFDSPPALSASPASVLAMQCGQLVFVVRADRTAESDLREALELLSGCPRQQLLLNGVEFDSNNRRFGTYYGLES